MKRNFAGASQTCVEFEQPLPHGGREHRSDRKELFWFSSNMAIMTDEKGFEMGPSAPLWMSVLYYIMCMATLIVGVAMLVKGTVRRLYSLVAVIAVPLFFLNNFHTIARVGVDPFAYWQQSLIEGQWWAWLSLVLFLYMIGYWVLLVRGIRGRRAASIKGGKGDGIPRL